MLNPKRYTFPPNIFVGLKKILTARVVPVRPSEALPHHAGLRWQLWVIWVRGLDALMNIEFDAQKIKKKYCTSGRRI